MVCAIIRKEFEQLDYYYKAINKHVFAQELARGNEIEWKYIHKIGAREFGSNYFFFFST